MNGKKRKVCDKCRRMFSAHDPHSLLQLSKPLYSRTDAVNAKTYQNLYEFTSYKRKCDRQDSDSHKSQTNMCYCLQRRQRGQVQVPLSLRNWDIHQVLPAFLLGEGSYSFLTVDLTRDLLCMPRSIVVCWQDHFGYIFRGSSAGLSWGLVPTVYSSYFIWIHLEGQTRVMRHSCWSAESLRSLHRHIR